MRARIFLLSLALVLFGAVGSHAALSKYRIRVTQMLSFDTTSPAVEILTLRTGSRPYGTTVIDDDGGSGFPILAKHLELAGGAGVTVDVPGLSGFVFVKQLSRAGPVSDQTGTGDLSSSIEWGFVTGWTITGGRFCNSVPATICDLASANDDETASAPFDSAKFDFNSWFFHPTGFRTLEGYISNTGANTGFGNVQIFIRGLQFPDGTVPALPLLGIGAVGLSVVALGISSLKKRR